MIRDPDALALMAISGVLAVGFVLEIVGSIASLIGQG
jgi:hypothetical protein